MPSSAAPSTAALMMYGLAAPSPMRSSIRVPRPRSGGMRTIVDRLS